MSFGTIYTHELNPRTTSILAVAKEQGLQLEVIYADKEGNKENYEKLLRINPLGQVPTFVGADGYVLTECMAIALYITSRSDTTTLLGSTRREYFETIKWMSLANSDLLPNAGGVVFPLIGRTLPVRKDHQDSLRAFHEDCRLLESHLSTNKYLVTDHVTLADFFTASMMKFPFMLGHKVLHAKYPRLTEWFNRVYEMRMFKEVAGDLHLVDAPFPTL
ncbi:putative elongation factor 1-gamma protein [Eutypa lata UCREL1]|uniref:Putative elongation factor 1-gamma protein n=1 Tax=Eutypa lata (strain UCR-EL1) TaxID=1287681 RepID=M7TBH0_EUTLA|nr:putative elongation factor 1-gamma protein [Eutypa lata UCREL1]